MKLFVMVVLFAFSLYVGAAQTAAQASTTGAVTSKSPAVPEPKKSFSEITKTDFKNFTFPIPIVGNLARAFTLNNGKSEKKEGLPNFRLRKTYYFDLIGDNQVEAISHIIVDGCQLGCESSSLFYIHKLENNQPKLIWKIAI